MIEGWAKKTFALRLKMLREDRGLSQSELAEKLGVSRGSVSFYENAERTPDIEFLNRVRYFFDVPYDYLMGYIGNKIHTQDDKIGFLGLSDKAIDILLKGILWNEFVGRMIEHEKFEPLMTYMVLMIDNPKFIKIMHDNDLNKAANDFMLYKLTTELSAIIKDCIGDWIDDEFTLDNKVDGSYAECFKKTMTDPYNLNKLVEILSKQEPDIDRDTTLSDLFSRHLYEFLKGDPDNEPNKDGE